MTETEQVTGGAGGTGVLVHGRHRHRQVRSPPTSTTGRPGGRFRSPSAADSCGATTMTPSTDWDRRRSIPLVIQVRLSAGRLAMLTR
ncbi:hypothetical protein GCM10027612_70030 [Microbispora bryophytorum subsp. camponoti]